MEQNPFRTNEPRFEIGQKVLRGDIPGEIRAIFTSRRGKTLYVVEYLSGVFRTCRPSQLERKE